jgi:hypothetical protein
VLAFIGRLIFFELNVIPINHDVFDTGPSPGQSGRWLVQIRPAITFNRQIATPAREAVRRNRARVKRAESAPIVYTINACGLPFTVCSQAKYRVNV